MKFLILWVLCFGLLESAIIPEIVTGRTEFHRCLVSFVKAAGIRTELAVEDTQDDKVNCGNLHASIEAMIDTIYENMENALPGGLHNASEIECVMDTFKAYKFFEINIVLAAAHLTKPEIAKNLELSEKPVLGENPERGDSPSLEEDSQLMGNALREVHAMTKTIFAIAAMKCFWDDDNLLEIVEDFSRKVNVSEKEFDCIVLDLVKERLPAEGTEADAGVEGKSSVEGKAQEDSFADRKMNKRETSVGDKSAEGTAETEVKANESDATAEGKTIVATSEDKSIEGESTTEGESTLEHEPTTVFETTEPITTEDTKEEPETELPNAITKLSPEEASIEATKSCASHLEEVSDRIKHYEFTDLTYEQNQCMSNQIIPANVTAVYEVIFLQKEAKTPEDHQRRRELLESLIVGCIWNLVECTDIFGFKEFIVDDLLPHLE